MKIMKIQQSLLMTFLFCKVGKTKRVPQLESKLYSYSDSDSDLNLNSYLDSNSNSYSDSGNSQTDSNQVVCPIVFTHVINAIEILKTITTFIFEYDLCWGFSILGAGCGFMTRRNCTTLVYFFWGAKILKIELRKSSHR